MFFRQRLRENRFTVHVACHAFIGMSSLYSTAHFLQSLDAVALNSRFFVSCDAANEAFPSLLSFETDESSRKTRRVESRALKGNFNYSKRAPAVDAALA